MQPTTGDSVLPDFVTQFSKYVTVGVVNTLVGLSVIYALQYFAKSSPFAANAAGYAVGLTVSFVLNKRWSFRSRRPSLIAFPRFLLVVATAYLANLSVLDLLIGALGVNAYLAQALAIPAYTLTSFLGCRWLVFTPSRASGSGR